MAESLVKNNKCYRTLIRGTETIASLDANEEKIITIKIPPLIAEDSVCIVNEWDGLGFIRVDAVNIGHTLEGDNKSYIIIHVTNMASSAIANATLNWIII